MENARHIFDSAGVSGTGVETVAPLKFDGTNNPRHHRTARVLPLNAFWFRAGQDGFACFCGLSPFVSCSALCAP